MADYTSHPAAIPGRVFPLHNVEALSFDCYGTLINWETGLLAALSPLLSALPEDHPMALDPATHLSSQAATASYPALQRINTLGEEAEVKHPTWLYGRILSENWKALRSELGISATQVPDEEGEKFGRAPGTWEPFADTVAALKKLQDIGIKLVILSNIDEENIAHTQERIAGVKFDAVYTAERIGSYKPDKKNFRYLFDQAKKDLGVYPMAAVGAGEARETKVDGTMVHVARSLTADHTICKEIGYASVWISRGGDSVEGTGIGGDLAVLEGKVGFGWKFRTLGEFADALEKAKKGAKQ